MNIIKDPSPEKIQSLIEESEQKAAKWLKDLECGSVYYWPADWNTHAQIAGQLQINDYDKGIVT